MTPPPTGIESTGTDSDADVPGAAESPEPELVHPDVTAAVPTASAARPAEVRKVRRSGVMDPTLARLNWPHG